jgi:hypothetical protein
MAARNGFPHRSHLYHAIGRLLLPATTDISPIQALGSGHHWHHLTPHAAMQWPREIPLLWIVNRIELPHLVQVMLPVRSPAWGLYCCTVAIARTTWPRCCMDGGA